MSSLYNMDPAAQTAVIIERLDRIAETIKEDRHEYDLRIAEMQKEIGDLSEQVRAMNERQSVIANRAYGGYLVLMGLGGMLFYIFDAWSYFKKLFA